MEARVAGQAEFDGGGAQGAADPALVAVAGGEPEQGARLLLDGGVRVVGPGQGPPQLGRAVLAQRPVELGADQRGLGLDVQSREDEHHLAAPAADPVQPGLEGGWRGLAAHTADPYPVRALGGEADGVEPGGDVGAGVARACGLVEELGGDGAGGHRAAGARVLGDDAAAVGVQFGDREAWPGDVVLPEEGVVASGGLGSAFEDVAGHHGAGEGVEVGRAPAEVGGGRSGHQGGVGDPAGDDEVGAAAQALGDAEGAEVGVGRQQALRQAELGGAGQQIVSLDVADPQRAALVGGEFAQRVGEPGGVEAAGVHHDPHPPVQGQAEAVVHLAQEGPGVAEARILQAVPGEDQHGEFGEVVAGEDVQRAIGEHLPDGREAVTVEARSIADPQHRDASPALPSAVAQQRGTGPEKKQACLLVLCPWCSWTGTGATLTVGDGRRCTLTDRSRRPRSGHDGWNLAGRVGPARDVSPSGRGRRRLWSGCAVARRSPW